MFKKDSNFYFGVVTGILGDQTEILCFGVSYTRPASEIIHIASSSVPQYHHCISWTLIFKNSFLLNFFCFNPFLSHGWQPTNELLPMGTAPSAITLFFYNSFFLSLSLIYSSPTAISIVHLQVMYLRQLLRQSLSNFYLCNSYYLVKTLYFSIFSSGTLANILWCTKHLHLTITKCWSRNLTIIS